MFAVNGRKFSSCPLFGVGTICKAKFRGNRIFRTKKIGEILYFKQKDFGGLKFIVSLRRIFN